MFLKQTRPRHKTCVFSIKIHSAQHPAIAYLMIGPACPPLLVNDKRDTLTVEPSASNVIRTEVSSETRSGLLEHSSRSAHVRSVSVQGEARKTAQDYTRRHQRPHCFWMVPHCFVLLINLVIRPFSSKIYEVTHVTRNAPQRSS